MQKFTRSRLFKVIALCAIAVSAAYLFRNSTSPRPSSVMQEFYTDDDGMSWFTDDATKLAPFDHNGKTAVLCHVYQCGEGQKFVGYLEQYSPAAKARLEGRTARPGITAATQTADDFLLVKKAGTGQWVPSTDPGAQAIRAVACPGGKKDFRAVVPGQD